jgi:thermitase
VKQHSLHRHPLSKFLNGHCAAVVLGLILNLSAHAASKELQSWGLDTTATGIKSAWTYSQGSKNVVVAVIDTGIDAKHPDLKSNLWKSPVRGGSLVSGQTYGWDFVTRSSNPSDTHGHGTHIAGIIVSAAPQTQIMPIRYYSETASGDVNLANTIKALHYAIDNGAKIINYSGGGPEYSEEEFQAMKKAERKGVLIVAAAGNDRHDTDLPENRYYPAAYKLKGLTNIISVASMNSEGKILSSSNFGSKSVDIAAPGEGIQSALPGQMAGRSRYGKMTGTSQATAFVSGVAALILAKQPSLTPVQVKDLIIRTAEPMKHLFGKVATGGRINALAAMKALTPAAPVRSTASKIQ